MFLRSRQQVRHRPTPAVQSPYQHCVDFTAARGLQQFLTRLSLRRTRANLADLQGDLPTSPDGILPHGTALYGQCLLIVGGHAGVEARSEHFWMFSCLAENVVGFYLLGSPLYRHFGASPSHGRRRSFPAR